MTDELIVVATSAPPARPEYRREFLTCLAGPTHHWASFTYRAKWIEPELLQPQLARDASALLMFCDVPGGAGDEFEFIPFRLATLRGYRPAEVVRRELYGPETHLAIDFQLGRYVHAPPSDIADLREEWSAAMQALPHRPRPYGHEVDGQTRFMFRMPPLAEGVAVGADTSWRTLSEQLADCSSLDGAYFFRVARLRRRGKEEDLKLSEDARKLEYVLRTGGEYRLDLDAYSKTASPAFPDAIETLATSERLLVENPDTTPLGTGVDATIAVTAGPVQAPVTTTLVLRGRDAVEDKAPRLELKMRIEPDIPVVVWVILLIASGTALSGLSKSDLGVSTIAAVTIKGAGVVLLMIGLFIAARRAPGISK